LALVFGALPEHVRRVNGGTGNLPIETGQTTSNSPTVFSVTELGKAPGQWTLTLHPEHLALAESPGAQPYVILRDQVMKSAILIEGVRALALKQPFKKTFKLTPEATVKLSEWIGKPTLAAYYLRQRYAWVLPVAVVWMLGSLPLRGDPAKGIDAVPFDPIGLGLGLTLVVSWACARWRPHPLLFLVDSLWFIALAGYLVMGVVNGRSKGWLVLVVLLLWMVVTGLRHFARFRSTTVARPRG
jgi:hypothetical protein